MGENINPWEKAARLQEQLRRVVEPYAKIAEQVSAAARQFAVENQAKIEAMTSGFQRVAQEQSFVLEKVRVALLPHKDWMMGLARVTEENRRLEEAGWLPHRTTLSFLVEKELDAAGLSIAIEAHYRDSWPQIEAEFIEQIEECDLDDEAKLTFREALSAHGSGHYRSVCRVLFPEFERITRVELHAGKLKGLASQREFRQLVGSMGLSTARGMGPNVFRLFEILLDHLYTRVEDPDQVEAIRYDPIPNRNAALHGILSYNSAKSSINMLILASFVYQIIHRLKQPSQE